MGLGFSDLSEGVQEGNKAVVGQINDLQSDDWEMDVRGGGPVAREGVGRSYGIEKHKG